MNAPIDKDQIKLQLLRLLEENPRLTQRDMTRGLNVSLGKINYCLSELSKQGLIRMERFRTSKNKSAYMYHLTPDGIEAIGRLAFSFLKRKIREYDALKREIETLNHLLQDIDPDLCKPELEHRLKGIIE